MEIVKAEQKHKEVVLKLLDDFRTECAKIISPDDKFISTTARDSGGSLFDHVIKSPDSATFLAKESDRFVGIISVYKIPQIRRGSHCAEIEEMYVIPEYQGKGVAQKLVDAVVSWAKKNRIMCIRLESGKELERAHGFYEKVGFRFYGRAYEMILE